MTRSFAALSVVATLTLLPGRLRAEAPLHHAEQRPTHHQLEITLHPQEHRLAAKDTITVADHSRMEATFRLLRGLKPVCTTPEARVNADRERGVGAPFESFTVTLPPGEHTFVIEYGGTIYNPLERFGGERAGGLTETTGIISEEGVYLSGSSIWYPKFADTLVTFDLTATVPAGWDTISQGDRTLHTRTAHATTARWAVARPQEEIYLVAGPFTEYRRSAGTIETLAMLRTPDENLASKYLNATAGYLDMYERLIGPYPYGKFALVENFWETGLGMPSFTLLGPTVVRLPFILQSSYPHEILHNWWGNGVFTSLAQGNWSEGLTAYLSDHLAQEQSGHGAEHRQSVLQKYADYVSSGRDFPLTAFRARHSAPSEAVGYGKSAMFFHMLRQRLGDEIFVRALRHFYRKNVFHRASFDDVRRSFEEVSGGGLRGEFAQWITREGAPSLRIERAGSRSEGDGYVLTAALEQIQEGLPYRLQIPIALTLEGREQAYQTVVEMEAKRVALTLRLPALPLRLDVDPEYDIFRRLDRGEVPPAFTQVFGARRVAVVLPSAADDRLRQSYVQLSESLSQSGPDQVAVLNDTEIKELPRHPVVILLGWENRFFEAMTGALTKYGVTVLPSGVKVGDAEIARESHSFAFTARHPDTPEACLAWIASDTPAALRGVGRKLPHYHKYSYLAFEGVDPTNVAKGRWPVLDSPMTVSIPREDGTIAKVERGTLAARTPLASPPPISPQAMDGGGESRPSGRGP